MQSPRGAAGPAYSSPEPAELHTVSLSALHAAPLGMLLASL